MGSLATDVPKEAAPRPVKGPYGPSELERVNVARLFQPYLERIWLILLLALLGGAGAFLYASRLPKVYSATATIQAEIRARRIIGIEAVSDQNNYDEATVNTVAQKICSLTVLEQVARTNRLVELAVQAGMSNVTEASVVGYLRSSAKSKLRKDTRLVDITVESTNAALAARLANSIVQEFLYRQSLMQSEYALWGSEALYREARDLETRLRESERRLQEFREKNRLVSIEEQQRALGGRLAKLEQDLVEAQSRRQQAESDQRAVPPRRQDLNDLLTIPSVATDAAVVAARSQYAGLQLAFSAATNRYKPAHPKYLQAYQQLTNGYAALVNSAEDAVRALEQRVTGGKEAERRIQAGIEVVQGEIQRVNALSSQFGELQRQVETDTTIQQSVLKRIKELELSKDLAMVPLSLVEPAWASGEPVRPKVRSMVAGGFLAGLFAALGIVYLLQNLDSSLRTVDETEERLRIPVLGAVGVDDESARGNRRLVVVDDNGSLAAEGFRSLSTTTGLLGRQENLRVQLVTSAVPSEGKTFCSVNYASTLARLGQKVVLVDFDLRRPAVGNTLGISPSTSGVTTYLLGQDGLDNLLLPTRVDGLKVMVAGPMVPNPLEQLSGPYSANLINELRQRFDVVVLDTAPVNSVSDTLRLVHLADVVLLVVRAGKTPELAVKRAMEQLRRASARLRGVVLNQVPTRGGYGYYYHYYNKDGYKSKGVYGAEDRKGK